MEYEELLTKEMSYTEILKAAERLKVSYEAVEKFGLLDAVNQKIEDLKNIKEDNRVRNLIIMNQSRGKVYKWSKKALKRYPELSPNERMIYMTGSLACSYSTVDNTVIENFYVEFHFDSLRELTDEEIPNNLVFDITKRYNRFDPTSGNRLKNIADAVKDFGIEVQGLPRNSRIWNYFLENSNCNITYDQIIDKYREDYKIS